MLSPASAGSDDSHKPNDNRRNQRTTSLQVLPEVLEKGCRTLPSTDFGTFEMVDEAGECRLDADGRFPTLQRHSKYSIRNHRTRAGLATRVYSIAILHDITSGRGLPFARYLDGETSVDDLLDLGHRLLLRRRLTYTQHLGSPISTDHFHTSGRLLHDIELDAAMFHAA